MTKLQELLNKVDGIDSLLVEDFNKPLTQYFEMAAFSWVNTGIRVKGKNYNIVLADITGEHSHRIKFSVKPDTNEGEFLISIYKSSDTQYTVLYNSHLQTRLNNAKDAIKLAVVFYENNKESINSFIDRISRKEYVPLDEQIVMVNSWVKVNEKDKCPFEILYKKV